MWVKYLILCSRKNRRNADHTKCRIHIQRSLDKFLRSAEMRVHSSANSLWRHRSLGGLLGGGSLSRARARCIFLDDHVLNSQPSLIIFLSLLLIWQRRVGFVHFLKCFGGVLVWKFVGVDGETQATVRLANYWWKNSLWFYQKLEIKFSVAEIIIRTWRRGACSNAQSLIIRSIWLQNFW